MNQPIETIQFGKRVAKIYYDQDAQDPSDNDGFLTKITYRKNSRHTLGTEPLNDEGVEALAEKLASGECIGVNVYAYVHSGVRICAADANPFHCPWDSGQSGVAYMPLTVALENFGTKEDKLACAIDPKALTPQTREKVIACLKAEVETYSQYLSGDVYGVVIETKGGKEKDSCWGFFGLDYAREQAKEMAK
jgi:hypothetical protein